MYTRKQYLNKECSHREYYGQFVTDRVTNLVSRVIGVNSIKKSTDEHFNDIPLKEWDSIFFGIGIHSEIANKMRECGDYPTLAGNVCITKEAARQIREIKP